MSKISPFKMEQLCFNCGSKNISNCERKAERYCRKCCTVSDNISIEL